ncbi:serine hydrolase [Paraliomyxa miuraensis]|uniref:serine hydrolase n=1 Tax=Paraliomyxa miuraensis TaxID=376150 RepID=UPI00225A81B4|nr:serine hydrolase [Paraliomyxa miuraensis]MCX4247553.1 serine hydrolase [Paraliomyxa miuraensis]
MPTAHPAAALTRHLGLALALWAAACGKSPQTTSTVTPEPPKATAPAEEDDLPARLERLSARLEEARVRGHIPGMAVAVVKGDEVIFAEGFGLADLKTKRPVTPKTVFAVGSTTKAFTSALVAMQIDAGKLRWDDPVSQHVPELKLVTRPKQADGTTAQPTLRDVLCHRTGFTRMSLLWYGSPLTTNEVFTQASGAEPIADFREKFHYNNVTYAAAGEAAARTAGTTWEALLKQRLFDPLGMSSTNVTVPAAKANENLAQGYRWREVQEVHEALPMREIVSVAPAGAINSTVLDMAQWVRLQLGRGTFEGKSLVSAERLQETWSSQIEVGGGIHYGLGWMLGDWQGHRVVEHGGNIDGYAAEVAMLPDDGIGFVLLTNISVTPLQRESMGLVFDSLLGELPKDEDEGPALDLRPYTGRYVVDFGPWSDDRFTVTDEGGRLFVDVPGQRKYELRPPNAEGRWVFALTDTIQVYFDRGADGRAQVLHMLQGGLDLELPREGYAFPIEITPEEAADLVGRFRSDTPPLEASVRVESGRLVADIKGQMAFALRKPGEDGRWKFRAKDDIAVSFRRDDKGKVDALIVHQGGADVPLARVATKERPLPTVEELLKTAKAQRTTQRLRKLGPIELTGKVRMPSSNIEGRFRMVIDADHHGRLELDLGRHGRLIDTYDGTSAWSISTIAPPTESKGKYLEQAAHSLAYPIGDFTAGWDGATVEDRVGEGKDERVVVVLRAEGLPPAKVFVDPKTGKVTATEQMSLSEGVGVIPAKGEVGEYRKALGLELPHRVSSFNEHSGATIFEIESVKKAEGDLATLFGRPKDL